MAAPVQRLSAQSGHLPRSLRYLRPPLCNGYRRERVPCMTA